MPPHDAELLDSWRLDEWLTLVTDDATDYVPPNDKRTPTSATPSSP